MYDESVTTPRLSDIRNGSGVERSVSGARVQGSRRLCGDGLVNPIITET